MKNGQGIAARLRRIAAETLDAFCRLNRIRYAAPWAERTRGRC